MNRVSFVLATAALAVFLGFRNNASYDRYWEARKLWGQLLNCARALTRQALTLPSQLPQGAVSADDVREFTQVLSAVPRNQREAALALGYRRWQTSLRIVIPTALPGVVTGGLLAVARISGETAPLLFTALNNQFFSANMNAPMPSLPVVIFQFALSPYEEWQKLAWTGALLITATVLALSVLARSLTARK